MPTDNRRAAGLLVLVVLVVLGLVAAPIVSVGPLTPDLLGGGDTPTVDGEAAAADVTLVSVGDGRDRLWPYTSRARSFETLTLPVNLVVEGNPARVRSLLLYSHDATWNETNESWQQASAEQAPAVSASSTWGSATGADRFTYVDTETGGIWIEESMQLHDGTYFGSRIHLRLYGGGRPGDSWTAIQAHRDYWDWFRLRHTVTSLAGPQHAVERDLMRQPTVVDVQRERFGNGGIIDADGWVTVVNLGPPQLSSSPPVDVARPADDPTVTKSTDDTMAAESAGEATLAQSTEGKTLARSTGEREIEANAGAGEPHETTVAANAETGETAPTGGSLVASSSGLFLSVLALAAVGIGGIVTAATRWDDAGAVVERLRWSRFADVRYQRGVALFVGLVALPIVVRWAALALEGVAPNHPKVIAGLLYPLFAFAPPLLAMRLPRGLSEELWFGVAFVGYGTGLVVDLSLVGVGVVPIEIVVHRFVVLVSLGLLAVVGQRRSTSTDVHPAALPTAVGLWVVLLAWPLLLGI